MIKRISTLALVSVLIAVACKTVPLTGRKGLKIYPSSEINAMSFAQYKEVISTSQMSRNAQDVAMVKRVGNNIKNAVEKYLNENGHADLIQGYSWEFNLIEGKDANAWCMPGGKVAFYTGILPICKDETGVAVVMGHEIAHAIAEHGNERMSQGMIQQMGGMALSEALDKEPEQTKVLAATAFGLGAQYGVMLPFSRKHESEADKMGLMFMAMAGYNPQEAAEFWKRMKSMSGGAQPPEFYSTHAAHDTRIKDIQGWMSEAMVHYNASKK
ncbi:MAG: M48 family metallopeptidase [Schleiferiaceae bacterium]|nr:M48 family metallopeptidase [Schleiferiaceae bacterium]